VKYILILLTIFGTGCAHIPSLFGQKEVVKTWRIHPDDMAQFKVDSERCRRAVVWVDDSAEMHEKCLRSIGYQLVVSKD